MIKNLALITTLFLISSSLYAEDLYPQDVAQFIETRDLCEHFSGEISGDKEVDADRNLNEQLDKYCKGIDQHLEALKLKYKNNQPILKKLNTYESLE